jgi:hypothetical protein
MPDSSKNPQEIILFYLNNIKEYQYSSIGREDGILSPDKNVIIIYLSIHRVTTYLLSINQGHV